MSPEESAARIGAGPEILRRGLLGFVTALIVARPLILGEDPGLSSRLTDSSSMLLSFFWLVAAVGWAAWRAWARNGSWYGGLVEAGLLLVVAVMFATATWVASYRHPAFLIAWEWLILLVVFSVVRRLARDPSDNQRLLAAMLASAVSVSAYAIYQYGVEMPVLRDQIAAQTEAGRQQLADRGALLEEHERESAALAKRVAENNVYATFAHPNAFAGFLALFIPAAIAACFTCVRRESRSWHSMLTLGAVLLLAVALWLTHSRGAILGLLTVGCGAVALKMTTRRLAACGLAAAALIVLFTFFAATDAGSRAWGLARDSYEKRRDYWWATSKMITEPKDRGHLWFGVGPGNFSRFYPRYMPETAHEHIIDPHNFVLETWATTGVFGVLALLATFTILLWKLAKAQKVDEAPVNGDFATRWEFYFGGMAGLILGFVLTAVPAHFDRASQDEFILNGVVAGGRAVVWFAMFALLESVAWKPTALRFALVAGMIALLLNLCVSGGINLPSVAQPFWVLAALALNTIPSPPACKARSWLAVVVPLPILAAICLYYLLAVYLPVQRSLSALSSAVQNYGIWLARLDPEWETTLKETTDPAKRLGVVNRNKVFVDQIILPRLQEATTTDPGNVVPLVELASWYGKKWKLSPDINGITNAVGLAQRATRLDPEGREGYLTLHRLNLLFAKFAQSGNMEFLGRAADAMRQVVRLDPTDARLRYQLADVLSQAGVAADARIQAEQSLRLDGVSSDPTRKLTSSERRRARELAGAPPSD